jgi:hypothetical protein
MPVPAAAQEPAQERPGLFGPPVLVLQPGVVHSLSPGASPDFNARFLTVIPTAVPRTALVAIVQWTPFSSVDHAGSSYAINSPSLVYGTTTRVAGTTHFTVFADGLFSYSPSASNPARSAYTHKFLVSGDIFIHVGRMVGARGVLSHLDLYGFVARVLTGLDDPDPPTITIAGRDRMVVLAGLSLPIAPW